MALKEEILSKIKVVYGAAIVLSLLIPVRIVFLQFFQHDKWHQMQAKRVSMEVEVQADRGNILARDGKILVSTVPEFIPRIDFRASGFDYKFFTDSLGRLSSLLSRYIGGNSAEGYRRAFMNAYKQRLRAYRITPNSLDFFQIDSLRKMPYFNAKRNKSGFYVEKKEGRHKPFISMASRTIGSMDSEFKHGINGLENAYNDELSGKNGLVLKKRVGSTDIEIPLKSSVPGFDIITTIDVMLQDVAESALKKQLSKSNAHHGCAVVMEVKTGDILAISNLTKADDGVYIEDYNYALLESTEPGSTFKLASFIAAFEDNKFSLDKMVDTKRGVVKFKGVKMVDSHEDGFGVISARQVFENSSNVGTSLLISEAYQDKPEKFIKRLKSFGLADNLDLEIPGEPDPFISEPGTKLWSGISLQWLSIGYESRLTPLQILTFYNAIANDGKMVRPRFVLGVYDQGHCISKNPVKVLDASICSASSVKKAKEILKGVVDNGTAINLRNTYLDIAGKTGTAQIAKHNKGYGNKTNEQDYRASFCGFFPADNPVYSCIVVVTSPSNSVFYGNQVAGPVFRQIADRAYSMHPEFAIERKKRTEKAQYTVPFTTNGYAKDLKTVLSKIDADYKGDFKKESWVQTSNKGDYVAIKEMQTIQNTVPNVVGMGAKDAIYLLEEAGMYVKIQGRGTVNRQSIRPGVRVPVGQTIYLSLS